MDNQFTKQIQDWLNTSHETDADIKKGADMLFRLNRNRFYHTRACCQPRAYRTNIEYELGKFLKIRLAGMTIEEVSQMSQTVMPEAQAIISAGAPDDSEELPSSDDTEEQPSSADTEELPSSDTDGVAVIRRGKRKDHEYLPTEVADLWDINAKRYKDIKSTFETLKAMSDKEPCDRFEYLKILSELDKKYRADMLTYDQYVVTRADRDRVAKARLADNQQQ